VANRARQATIGIDFLSKTMYLEDRTVRLSVGLVECSLTHSMSSFDSHGSLAQPLLIRGCILRTWGGAAAVGVKQT
jgi:hypothetical protein